MLSKTEKKYLSGNYTPSQSYRRYLNYCIKNKVKKFFQSELPLIRNSNVSDFTNVVSEFTNISNNHIIKQSLERGTNPRPNAYEAFALPG